jgi:glycosyltransferase involved in cell wall biosynthesis
MEVIFINDCSSDGSLAVIERKAEAFRKEGYSVKIISHEVNRGVAAARNTGLDHATGDYIYYVDADDRVEPDTVWLLVQEAEEKNADIVGCNWFLTFNTNERKMSQPAFITPWDAIRKMLNGTMRWNLWLFLVKRSLYENHQVRFTPGMNMGEDLMVMIKLFTQACRVTYLDEALYHYGQSNDQSLTKTYSDAHIRQVTANVKEVEHALLNSAYAGRLGDGIDFLKLNIKLPLLISDTKEQYQHWLSWFPEANSKVMANKALPYRTRLLQWLAVERQFWAIRLYYRVVIRFVYGLLYK